MGCKDESLWYTSIKKILFEYNKKKYKAFKYLYRIKYSYLKFDKVEHNGIHKRKYVKANTRSPAR